MARGADFAMSKAPGRASDELSAYKVPRRFLFLPDDDVPMMSSGKLDGRALKERFRW